MHLLVLDGQHLIGVSRPKRRDREDIIPAGMYLGDGTLVVRAGNYPVRMPKVVMMGQSVAAWLGLMQRRTHPTRSRWKYRVYYLERG